MVLGGGGYTIENVACTWANETAICVKKKTKKFWEKLINNINVIKR